MWSRSWRAATDFVDRLSLPHGQAAGENFQHHLLDSDGSYQRPTDEKGDRIGFKHIVPQRLALPPVGHRLAQLEGVISWPFDVLFSPAVLRRCRLTDAEVADLPRPPRSAHEVHMAEGHTYQELVTLLVERNMVILFDAKVAPAGPSNGGFAVVKDDDHDRFIVNEIPGNQRWSLRRLQGEYTTIIGGEPVRAARLGLGPKVMPLTGPDAVIAGVGAPQYMGGSDFENCFFSIPALPELLGSQRLPPIAGRLVGRPECATVVPVMVCATMGGVLSALVCQAVHRGLKQHLADTPLYMQVPSAQRRERRAAYKALEAAANDAGTVAWGSVPPELRAEFSEREPGVQRLPDELEVPVICFRLQLLTRDAAAGVQPDAVVEVRTHLLLDGSRGRAMLAQTNLQRRTTRRRLVTATSCLYLDDDGAFYGGGRRDPEDDVQAAASAHYLLVVACPLRCGMRQSWRKLRWPLPSPMKLLGLQLEIVGPRRGRRLRGQVAPDARYETMTTLLGFAGRAGGSVVQSHFASTIGSLTWQLMPTRYLLCGLDHAYRGGRRTADAGWTTRPMPIDAELADECYTLAGLLIFAVGHSHPDHGVLGVYDACGPNRYGNGGYGVALRSGLQAREAAELATAVGTEALGKLPCFNEPRAGEPPAARLLLPDGARAARRVSRMLRHEHRWDARENHGWRAVLEGEFPRPPAFIAIGEAIAGALTVSVMLRDQRAAGRRLYIGGDNQAACAAFRKGRSSTRAINKCCRRVAVLLVLHDAAVEYFWLPSLSNPADGPSRWWLRRAARRYLYRRQLLPLAGPNLAWVEDLTLWGCVEKKPGPHAVPAHRYNGRNRPAPLELGPGASSLVSGSVRPKTLRDYRTAMRGLDAFVCDRGHQFLTYSDAIRGYVEAAWKEGFATISAAKRALTALQFFNPEAAADNVTKLAWKAIRGWERRAPRRSHKPIPEHLADLFAVTCARRGYWDGAVALKLAVHIYARPQDIEGLQLKHVLMPGDVRSLLRDTAQVRVKDKRTGTDQTVIVDSPSVLKWLQWFLRWRRAQGRSQQPNAKVFHLPGGFNAVVRQCQCLLGFDGNDFVAHGCRVTGATRDWALHKRPILDIMTRGRWQHRKTCEGYLQAAQATLLALELPGHIHDYFAGDLRRADRELRMLRAACDRATRRPA